MNGTTRVGSPRTPPLTRHDRVNRYGPWESRASTTSTQEIRSRQKHHSTRGGAPWLGEALLTLRLESGHHRLVLGLEEDRWLEDNKRELGLTMQGPTHVLAVNGDARSVDYQDELFYLRQAAHALGARDPFRLTEVSLGDERQAPLQEAQVVLLADNSQLDVAFVAELRAFC